MEQEVVCGESAEQRLTMFKLLEHRWTNDMWELSIHCPEISPGHRVVGDVHCVVATKYIPSFGSVVFNQSSTMYPVGTTHPTDVIQIKNRSWSMTEDIYII